MYYMDKFFQSVIDGANVFATSGISCNTMLCSDFTSGEAS